MTVSAPGRSTVAVILAAGMGTRLGALGEGRPKGFVEIGGVPIVERSIACLVARGIDRIVIGTGFGASLHLSALRECPGFSTVAIASRRLDRARAAAQDHNSSAGGCQN